MSEGELKKQIQEASDRELELWDLMTVYAFFFPFIGILVAAMHYRLPSLWILLLPIEVLAFTIMWFWHRSLKKRGVKFGNYPINGGWS